MIIRVLIYSAIIISGAITIYCFIPLAIPLYAALIISTAALYGDFLRRLFADPKLVVTLYDELGSRTNVGSPGSEKEGIFFHLRIKNSSRLYPFHEVALYLLKIFEPDENGEMIQSWEGQVPMQFRHEEPSFKLPASKTIGPPWSVDLFNIRNDGTLRIDRTNFRPFNLPNLWNSDSTKPIQINLVVQARGAEGDSPPMKISIFWDGTWPESKSAVPKHITICVSKMHQAH